MEPVAVSSVLDAVTVYAEGAVCTRIARVTLTGGAPPPIRLAGLPLSLQEGSLRARVRSGPDRLRAADVRPGFDVELPAETDIPEEQRALEAAQERLEKLELERKLLDPRLAAITGLRPKRPLQRKGEPPKPAPVEAMLALGEFVERQLQALHERRRKLDTAIQDARDEVELRQRRVLEASTAKRAERARLTRTALVTLTGPASAGEIELAVEYHVPGASWAPSYELRLDRAMKTGGLRMRASVAQRTGEDWRGVRLSLSTADLARRTEAPELRSLRIGKSQPPAPRSGWRDPPPGLEELFSEYDRTVAARLPPPPPRASAAMTAAGQPKPPPQQSVEMEEAEAPSDERVMLGAMRMPAPAAAPMAPPMSRARRSLAMPMKKVAGGGAARGEMMKDEAPSEPPGPPPPEPELELGGDLLDYGRLVMAAPNDPTARGRLRPAPDAGAIELAALAAVSVRVEVMAFVAASQRQATEVARAPRPPQVVPVRSSAGSYDYRYDADHRVDVEADGAWHTVPVFSADVGLTSAYVCVPSVEPKAYRTVKVHNRSPHALLAGPVEVTLGDEFLMTAPFPTVPPGGEERFGLGVEEAIKVSRNTRFNESTGGLLAGAAVLSHELEIEVANRLPHAADVEVLERVPVTNEKEIRIEEGAVQPAWTPEKTPHSGVHVEGGRRWRVRLEPHESRKLTAQFTVRIPAQRVLVGGNRRV